MKKRYLDNLILFERIKKKLIKNGLPGDFAYIIMVESKFNPKCKYGIYRGIWQINPYIGKKFGGLKHNDELYDIDKSTDTIINYLKYLQKAFKNDHRLIIYAYNYGETKIRNLMKKYGKNIPLDKLPYITRNYIPKMIASKHILDQLQKK